MGSERKKEPLACGVMSTRLDALGCRLYRMGLQPPLHRVAGLLREHEASLGGVESHRRQPQ